MSADEAPAPPVLELRGLEATKGSRRLLAPSDVTLREGERVLLLGPSGAGKSLLVDLLLGFARAGVDGLEVGGSVRLDGQELLGRDVEARDERIGAVFQVHAPGLFDDLTILQNLRFGDVDEVAARAAGQQLGLDGLDRPATDASGGERVRVVLARTLLRGAGVLVCDEPTSGLDPGAAAQVVEAIAASHRRLTLVVTHDHAGFRAFADRVLLLDPATRRIVDVAPGDGALEDVRDALLAAAPPPPSVPPVVRSRGARLLAGWRRAAVGAADMAQDILTALAAPLGWLRIGHVHDGPRVRGALARDLAPGVAAFIGLAAALVALTATYFLFEHLPEREYAEPLFLDDLLGGLGLVLVRVGLPLVVSVLLAAKLGASTAAHLGHMSLTRQVDALRLLDVPLRRHLLLPAAGGQLAAAWVHTTLACLAGYVTSLLVFLWDHPGWSARYFHRAWLDEIETSDLAWLAAKVGASALAVAAVAYRVGTQPKREPDAVIRGIHATLLRGLLLVLAIHAAFAFLEFS